MPSIFSNDSLAAMQSGSAIRDPAWLFCTMALTIFSYVSSIYVTLRTLLPIFFPPKGNSVHRRSLNASLRSNDNLEHEQQQTRVKSAQRYQCYLALVEVLSSTVLLYLVSTEPSSIDTPTSVSIVLLFLTVTLRPTLLLSLSILSYLPIRQSKFYLPKLPMDMTIWLPPVLLLISGASAIGVLGRPYQQGLWIAIFSWQSVVVGLAMLVWMRLGFAVWKVRTLTTLRLSPQRQENTQEKQRSSTSLDHVPYPTPSPSPCRTLFVEDVIPRPQNIYDPTSPPPKKSLSPSFRSSMIFGKAVGGSKESLKNEVRHSWINPTVGQTPAMDADLLCELEDGKHACNQCRPSIANYLSESQGRKTKTTLRGSGKDVFEVGEKEIKVPEGVKARSSVDIDTIFEGIERANTTRSIDSNKSEKDGSQTRMAILRIATFMVGGCLAYIFTTPFLISKILDSNKQPSTVVSVLFSLGICISGPLLAIQVILVEGFWYKVAKVARRNGSNIRSYVSAEETAQNVLERGEKVLSRMSGRSWKTGTTAVDELGDSITDSFVGISANPARASSRLTRACSFSLDYPPDDPQFETLDSPKILSARSHKRSQSATLNVTYRQSISGFHPPPSRPQSRCDTSDGEEHRRSASRMTTISFASSDNVHVSSTRSSRGGILKHHPSTTSTVTGITPRSSTDGQNDYLRYSEGVSDADEVYLSESSVRISPSLSKKSSTLQRHIRKLSTASGSTVLANMPNISPESHAFGFKTSRVTSAITPPRTSTTKYRQQDLSIDFLSAQLLPRLVPSIKIGKDIVVRSEDSPIRRRQASFDEDLTKEFGGNRRRHFSLSGLPKITSSVGRLRDRRSTVSLGEPRRQASRPTSRQSGRLRHFSFSGPFRKDSSNDEDEDDKWIEILPDDENVTQDLATATRLEGLLEKENSGRDIPMEGSPTVPTVSGEKRKTHPGRARLSRKSKQSSKSHNSEHSVDFLSDDGSVGSENSASEAEIRVASRRASTVEEFPGIMLASKPRPFSEATSGDDEPTMKTSLHHAGNDSFSQTIKMDTKRFRRLSITESSESDAEFVERRYFDNRLSGIPQRPRQNSDCVPNLNNHRLSAVCETSFELELSENENDENVAPLGTSKFKTSRSNKRISELNDTSSLARNVRKRSSGLSERTICVNASPSKIPRRRTRTLSSDFNAPIEPLSQKRRSRIPVAIAITKENV